MRRLGLALAILLAVLAAAGLLAIWIGRDDSPEVRSVRVGVAPAGGLARARELIRACRVRSTMSLHSGVFYLELKDGSRVDLARTDERAVYAEIRRATPRCGPVTVAME